MRKKIIVIVCVMFLFVVFGEIQAIDFEGETITITTWSGRPMSYLEEYAPGRLEEAKEKFNAEIKIEEFAKGDLVDVNMSRLLSGDSKLDIWNMEHDQFWPLVADDALYPVDEFLDDEYYDNLPDLHQALANQWVYGGHDYYIGAAPAAYTTKMWLNYNKEILEEENLTDPYDLWKEGEWTLERWEEMMYDVTKDTTGDGEIDQRGFPGGAPNRDYLLWSVGPPYEEKDGEMVFTWHEEPAVEMLNKVHEWNEEGIVIGEEGDDYLFEVSIGWGDEFRAENHDPDDPDYGYITFPKSPWGEEGWNPSWAQLGYALPLNSERPEDLVEVLDFLYPPDEFNEHLDRMIESMALDRESYEALQWIYENDPVHVDFLGPYIGDTYMPAAEEARDEGGAASLMEAAQPEVQSALNDLFNQ